MSLTQAEALQRYEEPESVHRAVQVAVQAGWIENRGEPFFPTEHGRALLLRLTDALQQGTQELWSSHQTTVLMAAHVITRVVESGRIILQDRPYPAFHADVLGYNPASMPAALQLWTDVATLRYLRSDAHALAWQEADLSRAQIQILTHLRNSATGMSVVEIGQISFLDTESIDQGLSALTRRGWAVRTNNHWRLTPAGKEGRDGIEGRTNELNAAPFETVTTGDQQALLHWMMELPDEQSL